MQSHSATPSLHTQNRKEADAAITVANLYERQEEREETIEKRKKRREKERKRCEKDMGTRG